MITTRSGRAKIKVYPECKYQYTSDPSDVLELDGVSGFDIISGKMGIEIGAEMICNVGSEDPFNEYLRIYFENGETATYRNSFVDLFPY